MKKLFFPFLFATLFTISAHAQNTTFLENDKVLNVGLGIGNTLYTGSAYGSSIPPLSASLEFNVADEVFDENSSIGVGGYLGYASFNFNDVVLNDYSFYNLI